jgi:hypothetical protein
LAIIIQIFEILVQKIWQPWLPLVGAKRSVCLLTLPSKLFFLFCQLGGRKVSGTQVREFAQQIIF